MHDKLNIWLSVGGHIELDEDPIQAAYREVKEEVGLQIKIIGEAHGPDNGSEKNRGYTYLMPPRYLGMHKVNGTHQHIVLVYFATSETDEIKESIHEHERRESRWVSREELNDMDLVPNVRFYAEEALKVLTEK